MKRTLPSLGMLAAHFALLCVLIGVARAASPTVTFLGGATGGLTGVNALSGDQSGSASFGFTFSHGLKSSPTAPDLTGTGGFSGSITVGTSAVSLQLANTTNVVQTGGAGTITFAQGFSPAGKKLRAVHCENTSTTPGQTVTVSMPAANGLAGLGWTASNTVVVLQAGGDVVLTFPDGSSALTAGSNDGLSMISASGTVTVKMTAVFG